MSVIKRRFGEIDLNNPFFDSLKNDYQEFAVWFTKKADASAYVFYNDNGAIDGFLYLKTENDAVTDIDPPLPALSRIKIGTFKINPHGTRLGERFIKKAFDHAITEGVNQIYVTIFEHHAKLVEMFEKYGFRKVGMKASPNGTELVLLKDFFDTFEEPLKYYPRVNLSKNKTYLLALDPKYHSRLLPDSILRTEDAGIVQDVSHTNSIHKVYLAAMHGMGNLKCGDILLIYRTNKGEEHLGRAFFKSVATSICVVEEYRSIHSFASERDFLNYVLPYSVFSESELNHFWLKKSYPHVLRFSYNMALNKRVTRGDMINIVGLDAEARWGFIPLSKQQLLHIANLGKINEGLIINQA